MMEQFWIIKIGVICLILVAINYAIKYGLKYLSRRLKQTENSLKVNLEEIIYFPCHIALWLIGIAAIIEILGHQFNLFVAPVVLTHIRNALIVACLTWIMLRWKREIQKTFIVKHVDAQLVFIVGRVSSIVIFVIGGMLVMQILGVDIMPLLAFGGIGAAAIGFASQSVISNFCSGFMINITRPFTIGDWVLLPEKNVEAIVEEIGWYTTVVRDKEKRPIYLPNSIFSQQLVINSSRMSHRRILEKISVRYEDFSKLKTLAEEIKKIAASDPKIESRLPLLVYFIAFGEHSLDIQIDIYTRTTVYEEYLSIKQEFLVKAYEVIQAHGAEVPFPTRTIISKTL